MQQSVIPLADERICAYGDHVVKLVMHTILCVYLVMSCNVCQQTKIK